MLAWRPLKVERRDEPDQHTILAPVMGETGARRKRHQALYGWKLSGCFRVSIECEWAFVPFLTGTMAMAVVLVAIAELLGSRVMRRLL